MQIILELPDDIAIRAQNAGVLTEESVQRLLEDAMRRATGRQLLSMAERLHAAGIPAMNETELDVLIHNVRQERKNRNAVVL